MATNESNNQRVVVTSKSEVCISGLCGKDGNKKDDIKFEDKSELDMRFQDIPEIFEHIEILAASIRIKRALREGDDCIVEIDPLKATFED